MLSPASVDGHERRECEAPALPVLMPLGPVPYEVTLARMQAHVALPRAERPEQLWSLQHPPVFTQGLGGRPEHLLDLGDIPLVQSDRGGQVTYHGPGQLVLYTLIDVSMRGVGVRGFVRALEGAVIALLADSGIPAGRKEGAPGVYVEGAKIASLGLRLKNGMVYHGLSLNVQMDLAPFARINPCGMAGLPVTQMVDLGWRGDLDDLSRALVGHLARELNVPAGLR